MGESGRVVLRACPVGWGGDSVEREEDWGIFGGHGVWDVEVW